MATAARDDVQEPEDEGTDAEVHPLRRAREEAGWPEGETPPEDGGEEGDEAARRSARDRADEDAVLGEGEDEDDEQPLFVLENEKRVTLTTLFKRGTAVEFKVNLGSKGVKGVGNMGLVAFSDPEMLLVVPARAGKVVVDPTYTAEGIVDKVTITANLKPSMVYDARSEAAKSLLGIDEE